MFFFVFVFWVDHYILNTKVYLFCFVNLIFYISILSSTFVIKHTWSTSKFWKVSGLPRRLIVLWNICHSLTYQYCTPRIHKFHYTCTIYKRYAQCTYLLFAVIHTIHLDGPDLPGLGLVRFQLQFLTLLFSDSVQFLISIQKQLWVD